MKKSSGFALLALMSIVVAACGHGTGTSAVPPGHDSSGLARSAAAGASPGPSGSPVPTLYVAGNDRVVAFPLDASGNATPQRTLFVHRLQQDGIVGIATNADTTLDVLQNFRNSPTGPGTPTADGNFADCRVVIYVASASGDAAALNQYPCLHVPVGLTQPTGGVRGIGIARGAASLGAVDYLEAEFPAATPTPSPSPTPIPTTPPTSPPVVFLQPAAAPAATATPIPGDLVQRSNESGTDNGVLVVSSPQFRIHNGIAETTSGVIFISSSPPSIVSSGTFGASSGRRISMAATNPCVGGTSGTVARVDYYAPGAVGFATPITFVISGRISAGAVATYPVPDAFQRVYVATCDTNGYSWVDEVVSQNFPSGTVSPNRSIGPFTLATVTALAVDAQGNVYVGLSNNPGESGPTTGNAVRIYASDFANGSKRPTRSIEMPLAAPVNASQKITGLAITQ